MSHPMSNWFHLASAPSVTGVSCSDNGLFVGEVPLLERVCGPGGQSAWQLRAVPEINSELSKRFGLPVEFSAKAEAAKAIARALDRGDIALAQIATLHLRIPAPPNLVKSAPTTREVIELVRRLQASGLLKLDWDPEKHPRWPAGSSGAIGGEFAPSGSGVDNSTWDGSGASLIPAQIAIPAPLEIPLPRVGPLPLPFEILPPPMVVPNPRELPKNPYPNKRKCVKEWAEAEKFCRGLQDSGKMGKQGYRGFGKWLSQCIKGQVSEECGGNSTNAYEVIA